MPGRPVVLVFYPGDNTPVCTRQLTTYTAEIDAFREVDAQVLAISPQSVESHDGFSANQGGFAFPLLADVDKEVGRGPTASSGRWASTGARSSWSTPRGSSGTPTGRWPGCGSARPTSWWRRWRRGLGPLTAGRGGPPGRRLGSTGAGG